MLSKTKKLLLLSSGLAGALVVSSAAGVALSSCTVEAVNGGSGSSDSITLPDTWYSKDINWTDATSLNNLIIDKQGFVYSNKYMTEIIAILPGYDSSDLVIPSTVTSITGYNNVTTATAADGSITTTKTAKGAFEGIDSITNVKFAGNKITKIGARAFANCSSLQSVTLPSSITTIDTYAFYGCSVLSTINLSNIKYIGTSAFANAMSDVPSGSMSLDLNKTVFIGASAFLNATGITSVDFSKNTVLTRIAESAFSGCTELSSDIDLSNASKLVTLGSSSTPATSGSTFANTAITNVYLPSTPGLKTIAASTFSGCKNLVNVGPKGITGFKAVGSVSGIYNQAFAGTKITIADISSVNSATPLKDGAFSGMTELTSVNLGTIITTIPSACFMNCSSLTSLTLPSTITSISGGTPTLATITVGSGAITASPSITFSGGSATYPAFYGSGLTSIDLSNITSYQTTSGSALSLPDTLFYNATSLATVILKEGTTSIGAGSFANTTALTSIGTGSSTSTNGYIAASDITSVAKYAFWQSGISLVDISAITSSSYITLPQAIFTSCPNLTTLQLPSTITTIEISAVNDTPSLTTVNFENLPLTSIKSFNFYNCNLTEIDLTSAKITDFNTVSLFSGLSKDTVVKLSSVVWNISSTTAFTYNETTTDSNGSVTTTPTTLNVTFPDGFAPTPPTSGNAFTKGNLVDHTMFSRIGGSLDMSSFTALRSIGKRTFFGGPVSGLAFNASQFASGKFGNYYSNDTNSWSHLGFLGSSVTANNVTTTNPSTYSAANLPLGSMTNLNTITFNNFTNSTTTTSSSSVMAKTTESTWNQVTKIINSFAKSAWENDGTPVANLSTWEASDITCSVESDDDTDEVTSVTFTKPDSTVLLKIDDNTNSESNWFDYSGIKWTFNIDSNAGTITLTSSTDVDTYRLAVADNTGNNYTSYKAFFNTKSETTTDSENVTTTTTILPDSSITITLNIVVASTN